MNEAGVYAVSWLLTYLVHSTLLVGAAYAIERSGRVRSGAVLSGLWRAAIFGAILTASLQVVLATSPWHGRLHVAVTHATPITSYADAPPAAVPPVRDVSPSSARGANLPGHGEYVLTRAAVSSAPLPVSGPIDVGDTQFPGNVSLWVWLARHWPGLLLAAWATISAALFLRLGLGLLAARRELAGRESLRDGPAREMLRSLCSRAALARCPRLSISASLDGPVSLPNGEICLPHWALEALEPAQLRAMLAHELAHCRRRDPCWLVAGNVLQALLFIQPLNRMARAQLAAGTELACDDWASAHTGDRRALAECLFECLARSKSAQVSAIASAMVAEGSALTRRVRRLVSSMQPFNGEIGMKFHTVIIAILGGLALVAPSVLVEPSLAAVGSSAPSPASAARVQAEAARSQAEAEAASARRQVTALRGEARRAKEQAARQAAQAAALARAASRSASRVSSHHRISVSRHDHGMFITFDESGLYVKLYADGKFAFNAAEGNLASLAKGDRLEIAVRQHGTRRRIVFKNDGGAIKHRYYVNGTSRPFDAKARHWLAGILPEILRETALNAKVRIARIRKQGGSKAVLAEIGRIHSGYARSVYIRDFAQSAHLDADVVNRLIKLAAPIDSGYEREQALIGLYRAQDLRGKQLAALLAAGTSIDSGYEKSQLLKAVAAKMPLDAASVKTYLDMAAGVQSDYEMRMSLDALLKRAGLSQEALARVIAMAASHMHSSYELRITLAGVVSHAAQSDVVAKAYCHAVRHIDSSYDKRLALRRLLERAKLAKSGYLCVLDAAADIDSDYDRAALLTDVARHMPKDAALENKYHEIAEGIGSDFERKKAEDALRR